MADDIILIPEDSTELQVLIIKLNTSSNKVGVKMDIIKIKIMYNEFIEEHEILIYGTKLELVDEYIHIYI